MNDIKKIKIQELAARIRRQQGKVAILIGAGCSFSAGIPLCKGIMEDIKRDYPDYIKNCKEDYIAYINELSASERKQLFDNYIDNAKINLAHVFLASLVRNNFINCILTPNFDNLALKALTLLNQFPSVYDLASAADYNPGTLNYPALVYLHGQHTGMWQLNSDVEMDAVRQTVGYVLREVVENHLLIIIGYSGSDPVMEELGKIPQFRHNAYWVSYKDDKLSERVTANLFNDRKKSVMLIEGYDADKFFYDLHIELEAKVPALYTDPFAHLKECYALLSDELKIDDRKIDITKTALEIIEKAENANKQNMVNSDEDLETSSLKAFLGWKENDPDLLFEKVLYSDNAVAKENLAKAFFEKANSLVKLEEYNMALMYYNKAIELNFNLSEAYYNRGIVFNVLKEYDKAILDYNKAIELNPNEAKSYNNRGNVLNVLKEYNKAILDYNKAIELNPNYAAAYYNRGNVYYYIKEYDKAILDYNKFVELIPDNAVAYNNRGFVFENLKEYDKAILDYSKAIELNPNYAKVYINRGNVFGNIKVYDKAILDYSKAIELNPNDAKAYYNRGVVFDDLKAYYKAILDYSKAIELNPNYAKAYNNRGRVFIILEEYDKAILDYNNAIELNPNDADVYNNRGNVYYNIQEYDKAIFDYNKVIELNPNDADAYNNRGNVFHDLKEYDRAILDYSKAIELKPNNAKLYYGRANIYRLMNNFSAAMADIDKAIALDPDLGITYSTLAEIHAAQGNKEEFYKNITIALEKGFPVWEIMNEDDAYKPYLQEPRFIALIAKYKPQ